MDIALYVFTAIMGLGILIFLTVLGVIVGCERIAILRHQERRGTKKEIKRKLRKEIFKRLRARRKIIRQREKQKNRIDRARKGLGSA